MNKLILITSLLISAFAFSNDNISIEERLLNTKLIKDFNDNQEITSKKFVEQKLKEHAQFDDQYLDIISSLGQGKEGGDSVTCSDGSVYFLDYLIAKNENKSAKYIENTIDLFIALSKKLPRLSDRLFQIYYSFTQEVQTTGEYEWIDMPAVELDDENLSVDISKICGGTISQAVVRTKRGKVRKFYHQRRNLDLIEDQLSWVMLHELLWDYFDDAHTIRVANEFLHNKNNYETTDINFRMRLRANVGNVDFLTGSENHKLSAAMLFLQDNIDKNEEIKLNDKVIFMKHYSFLYSLKQRKLTLGKTRLDVHNLFESFKALSQKGIFNF